MRTFVLLVLYCRLAEDKGKLVSIAFNNAREKELGTHDVILNGCRMNVRCVERRFMVIHYDQCTITKSLPFQYHVVLL